jgi:hypothetical protein
MLQAPEQQPRRRRGAAALGQTQPRAPAAYAHRAGNPDRPAWRLAHRTGAIAASPTRSRDARRREDESDPGPRQPDARYWAIASARRDREIVSSARLILVISKRVSDLSADPPDACSRAAGQLTRRAARLLQSPLSGTVAGGHALAAGIAHNGQRAAGCWFVRERPRTRAASASRSWPLHSRSGGPSQASTLPLVRHVLADTGVLASDPAGPGCRAMESQLRRARDARLVQLQGCGGSR